MSVIPLAGWSLQVLQRLVTLSNVNNRLPAFFYASLYLHKHMYLLSCSFVTLFLNSLYMFVYISYFKFFSTVNFFVLPDCYLCSLSLKILFCFFLLSGGLTISMFVPAETMILSSILCMIANFIPGLIFVFLVSYQDESTGIKESNL